MGFREKGAGAHLAVRVAIFNASPPWAAARDNPLPPWDGYFDAPSAESAAGSLDAADASASS
jgi:hypothetical protein